MSDFPPPSGTVTTNERRGTGIRGILDHYVPGMRASIKRQDANQCLSVLLRLQEL